MRWIFILVPWCALAPPAPTFARADPIRACSLDRLPQPAPGSHDMCEKSSCVDLGRNRSVCKCLAREEGQPAQVLYFEGKKVAQHWTTEIYVEQTADFHVLAGDLRGDGHPLWIVVDHGMTSQGIRVNFWTLSVLDPIDPGRPPLSWSAADYGPGSFASPRGRHGKGCDILVTDWVEGREPGRGGGLYFVGTWFRLGPDRLEPLRSRPVRVRRYLFSFERERGNDLVDDDSSPLRYQGNPAKWLRPDKIAAHPAKIGLDAPAPR